MQKSILFNNLFVCSFMLLNARLLSMWIQEFISLQFSIQLFNCIFKVITENFNTFDFFRPDDKPRWSFFERQILFIFFQEFLEFLLISFNRVWWNSVLACFIFCCIGFVIFIKLPGLPNSWIGVLFKSFVILIHWLFQVTCKPLTLLSFHFFCCDCCVLI